MTVQYITGALLAIFSQEDGNLSTVGFEPTAIELKA